MNGSHSSNEILINTNKKGHESGKEEIPGQDSEEEKKDQELLIQFLANDRISKIFKIGTLDFEIFTKLGRETALAQKIALENDMTMFEANVINVIICIGNIGNSKFEFLDFKNKKEPEIKEEVLKRFEFIMSKPEGILGTLITIQQRLEQKIREICDPDRLKKL